MNTPVQRLEALLQRVQENRGKPRLMAPLAAVPAAAPAPPMTVARDPRRDPDPEPMELELEELPVTAPPPAPVAAPAAAAPRQPGSRGGSPLEMAVAGELDRPPVPPAPTPVGIPAPAVVAQAPARAVGGNVETFSPEIPQPSKPIAQVVSKHAPVQPSTFGDLLRRSLSLRPR